MVRPPPAACTCESEGERPFDRQNGWFEQEEATRTRAGRLRSSLRIFDSEYYPLIHDIIDKLLNQDYQLAPSPRRG